MKRGAMKIVAVAVLFAIVAGVLSDQASKKRTTRPLGMIPIFTTGYLQALTLVDT